MSRALFLLLACVIVTDSTVKPAAFQQHTRPAPSYRMANFRVRVAAHQAVRPAALAEHP